MFDENDDIKAEFYPFDTFRHGEEKAFDFFFRKYYPILRFFATGYLKDPDEAKDLVQECFVKLWEQRTRIVNAATIKTFLYTIVRNRCIDELRKKKTMAGRNKELSYLAHQWDTEEMTEVTRSETMAQIYAAIETLPPKMQQVFRLYFIEGKKFEEIAEQLQRSPGTVRNQKDRALVLLKGKLLSLITLSLFFL